MRTSDLFVTEPNRQSHAAASTARVCLSGSPVEVFALRQVERRHPAPQSEMLSKKHIPTIKREGDLKGQELSFLKWGLRAGAVLRHQVKLSPN